MEQNYPFHNVISGVAAAIYAGNAAVVKVSEFANHSRAFYHEIFRTSTSDNPPSIPPLPWLAEAHSLVEQPSLAVATTPT